VITEIKQKCLELLFSVRSHITPSFEILAHWRSFKIAEVKKKKKNRLSNHFLSVEPIWYYSVLHTS